MSIHMEAANPRHPFLFPSLLLILFLVASSAGAIHGASIATYWGQKKGEGSLGKACATGNYDYINIAYLTAFGSGQTPELHLPGHLNATHNCTCGIARDIKACQKRGVKVLLSLGGDGGREALNSAADAKLVAKYLYNAFLGGRRRRSVRRPFHGAVLDGVDFSVGGKAAAGRAHSSGHWDALARALAGYSTRRRKVYLTAAPPCALHDRALRRALATGRFDIAWVRFYDDASCQYAPKDLLRLKVSWETWNLRIRVRKVFFGMPASGEAAAEGYVSPGNFTRDVLPFIGEFPKYGGIMLWDRYYDAMNNYSDEVKYDIKKRGRGGGGGGGGGGRSSV